METNDEEMPQILDDDIMVYIHITLDIVVRAILSILGISSNIINMIIFSELGLKDSMSVALFAHSFTDFLTTSFQLASSVCFLTYLLYPTNPVDSWSLGFTIFGWMISAPRLISCWITAMISVERCFCVVSPFGVKEIFTRFRTIITVVIIYMLYIGIHVPIYAIHRMEWKDPTRDAANETVTVTRKLVLTVTCDKETVHFQLLFNAIVGTGTLFLSLAVVIVCAVWMGYSLEASSRVRQAVPDVFSGFSSKPTQSLSAKSSSTLSPKERRLVRVVLCLGVILVTFNIPKVVTVIVFHTVAGMDRGAQANLGTTLWATASAIALLDCPSNFFVYLTLNTKYKRCFHRLFSHELSLKAVNDNSK